MEKIQLPEFIFSEEPVYKPDLPDNGKVGLVLEGGGVKGAYHVGALRAIREYGYEFDAFAGTSIGALNSAVLVQSGFDALEDIWRGIKATTIFALDEELIERYKGKEFDNDFFAGVVKTVKNLKGTYAESVARMTEFVQGHLDEKTLRKSKYDLGLVTYNLTERKPVEVMKEEVPEGELTGYIQASATYPLFPPYVIENKKYIDGGVWDNLPINLLARNGYRKMVVVRTNVKPPKRRVKRDDLNLVCIVPSKDLGGAMSFDDERVKALDDLGYNDAKAVLQECKRAF